MALRLRLTPRAEADLDSIAAYIHQEAPFAGSAWFGRLEEALFSLTQLPQRCPVESALSTPSRQVRKLLFGRRRQVYRIYFVIGADTVDVLHIRHGARREPRL